MAIFKGALSDLETHGLSKGPTVFKLAGHTVDTRLKVFTQEFHVHSAILKQCSRYFRKFLDSADKISANPDTKFRYDYVSVVDTEIIDGEVTWGLEAVQKVDSDRAQGIMTDLKEIQEAVGFKQMLHAMYRLPFVLITLLNFQVLVRLADFYGACQAVSYGVLSACTESVALIPRIPSDPKAFLTLARHLRHKVLYKESMVHIAGRWHQYPTGQDQIYNPLSDYPELMELATKAHSTILAKVRHAQLAISSYMVDEYNFLTQAIIINRVQYHMGQRPATARSLASYFRNLHDDDFMSTVGMSVTPAQGGYAQLVTPGYARAAATHIRLVLAKVLSRRLVFNQNPGLVGGPGIYNDTFLCADIGDEDLPWDMEETDW